MTFSKQLITVAWTNGFELINDFKVSYFPVKSMRVVVPAGENVRLSRFISFRKPNILDNMISIMEKYASNLEALVEERTDQLREEKKKTEDILLQMLPR